MNEARGREDVRVPLGGACPLGMFFFLGGILSTLRGLYYRSRFLPTLDQALPPDRHKPKPAAVALLGPALPAFPALPLPFPAAAFPALPAFALPLPFVAGFRGCGFHSPGPCTFFHLVNLTIPAGGGVGVGILWLPLGE